MPTSPITREAVFAALSDLRDPETGRSMVQMEQVRDVAVDQNRVQVMLALTTWSSLLWDETRTEAEQLLRSKLPPGSEVTVQVVEHNRPPEKIGEIGLTAKSVIAVGSGKGGV